MADNAPATLTLLLRQDGLHQPEDFGVVWKDQITEGVLSKPTATTGDLAVTQRAAGANMSVDVAAGVAWVYQDTNTPKPGPAYRVRFAAVNNLTLTAAHATLARIDRVVVEVEDATFAGLTNLGQVRVIAGTPSGSPAAPAEPANAITLATIAVAALATTITNANITDLRPLVVSYLGGRVLGYAQAVANQATITAEADLTSLSVAVTVGASRRINISAYALFNRSVADGQTALRIKEGATVLQVATLDPRNTSLFPLACAIPLTPTAGAHTYKLTALQSTGTGSTTMNAAATFPAFILVQDIGPA